MSLRAGKAEYPEIAVATASIDRVDVQCRSSASFRQLQFPMDEARVLGTLVAHPSSFIRAVFM